MKELLDMLVKINQEMDKLDGRVVHRGRDEPDQETIERIANALKRRETVRNR